jgi:hypothetical protein
MPDPPPGVLARPTRGSRPGQARRIGGPAGAPTAYWIVNTNVLETLAMPDGAGPLNVTKAV